MTSLLDRLKSTPTSHSSTVTMTLHIGSEKLRVVQSSKGAIKLKTAQMVPPGDAVLETVVDGRSHLRPIRVLSTGPSPNWISIVDR
jgi:hypothetical protein